MMMLSQDLFFCKFKDFYLHFFSIGITDDSSSTIYILINNYKGSNTFSLFKNEKNVYCNLSGVNNDSSFFY